MDVPDAEGVFFKHSERISCLVRFEWCVWVRRCVSLLNDSSGVCLQSYELILVL